MPSKQAVQTNTHKTVSRSRIHVRKHMARRGKAARVHVARHFNAKVKHHGRIAAHVAKPTKAAKHAHAAA